LPNISPRYDAQGNPVPDAECTPGATRCGNISDNPLFVHPLNPLSLTDRGDVFRYADYRLQRLSSSIDRGEDVSAPLFDLDGVYRVQDIPGVGNDVAPNEPAPRAVDIGAFEYVAGSGDSGAVLAAFGTRGSSTSGGSAVAAAFGGGSQQPGSSGADGSTAASSRTAANSVHVLDYLLSLVSPLSLSGDDAARERSAELVDLLLQEGI